jgi:hypothetical protein
MFDLGRFGFRKFDLPMAPGMIYHMRQPNLPGYRFEYHPGVKKVYVIRVGVMPEVGEAFAFDIENHGAAWNAVLYWVRGYREHERATTLLRS